MEDLIVPIGVPVTIIVILSVLGCVAAMAYSFGLKHPRAKNYTLDDKWEHGPLLFSAVDMEPVALPRHAAPDDVDGGSASGKW